jgi:hypothetical protein
MTNHGFPIPCSPPICRPYGTPIFGSCRRGELVPCMSVSSESRKRRLRIRPRWPTSDLRHFNMNGTSRRFACLGKIFHGTSTGATHRFVNADGAASIRRRRGTHVSIATAPWESSSSRANIELAKRRAGFRDSCCSSCRGSHRRWLFVAEYDRRRRRVLEQRVVRWHLVEQRRIVRR